MVTSIDMAAVPGMTEALAAVQLVGGVLLDRHAAEQLTVAAWWAAEPHARSAALADASDLLFQLAETHVSGRRAGLLEAALILDVASAEARGVTW